MPFIYQNGLGAAGRFYLQINKAVDRVTLRYDSTSLFLVSTAHFINTRCTVLATYRGRTSHFTLAAKRTNKSHHRRLPLPPAISASIALAAPALVLVLAIVLSTSTSSQLIFARICRAPFMHALPSTRDGPEISHLLRNLRLSRIYESRSLAQSRTETASEDASRVPELESKLPYTVHARLPILYSRFSNASSWQGCRLISRFRARLCLNDGGVRFHGGPRKTAIRRSNVGYLARFSAAAASFRRVSVSAT